MKPVNLNWSCKQKHASNLSSLRFKLTERKIKPCNSLRAAHTRRGLRFSAIYRVEKCSRATRYATLHSSRASPYEDSKRELIL